MQTALRRPSCFSSTGIVSTSFPVRLSESFYGLYHQFHRQSSSLTSHWSGSISPRSLWTSMHTRWLCYVGDKSFISDFASSQLLIPSWPYNFSLSDYCLRWLWLLARFWMHHSVQALKSDSYNLFVTGKFENVFIQSRTLPDGFLLYPSTSPSSINAFVSSGYLQDSYTEKSKKLQTPADLQWTLLHWYV